MPAPGVIVRACPRSNAPASGGQADPRAQPLAHCCARSHAGHESAIAERAVAGYGLSGRPRRRRKANMTQPAVPGTADWQRRWTIDAGPVMLQPVTRRIAQAVLNG